MPQNRKPGWSAAAHFGQSPEVSRAGGGAGARSGWPQSRQNANEGSFSRPHRTHFEGFAMPGHFATRGPPGQRGIGRRRCSIGSRMRECPECRNANADAARFCTSCGAATAASAEPPDPWIGRVVNGKFRVEALIGQGGMGRVYRARHLALDRTVVLKMLHNACSSDGQIVQRFQREARAASRLDHPNSIAVLDFGEAEDGTLFMAMEHVGGRDLARRSSRWASRGSSGSARRSSRPWRRRTRRGSSTATSSPRT
jgi:hypothetical protein